MSAHLPDLNNPDDCRAFGRILADILLSSLRSRSLDQAYRELMRAYDESAPLRMVFDGLLEGLGGEVIERHRNLGLVVGVTSGESPLLSHVERTHTLDEKRLMAVVLATMLALYYPADVVDDPTLAPRPLTVLDIHRKISLIIDAMRAEARANGNGDDLAIWELVSDRMSLERTSGDKGYIRATVAGHIERMFRLLERHSLVTKAVLEEDTGWRPTLLFFSYVQNRLNHSMYVEISAALSKAAADGRV